MDLGGNLFWSQLSFYWKVTDILFDLWCLPRKAQEKKKGGFYGNFWHFFMLNTFAFFSVNYFGPNFFLQINFQKFVLKLYKIIYYVLNVLYYTIYKIINYLKLFYLTMNYFIICLIASIDIHFKKYSRISLYF